MRKLSWLLLLVAGCAGPDADPIEVAERFHAARSAGDAAAVHALLAPPDRAALPASELAVELPAGLALEILGGPRTGLDSASLVAAGRDSAVVVLHTSGPPDTLRLRATRERRGVWTLRRERVRWRVSMGLAEWARIDSLAALLDPEAEPGDSLAVSRAGAYLALAGRHPRMARPADLDEARAIVQRATVAEALRVELRVQESFMGSRFVRGRIENPSDRRVATLRLRLRDTAGAEEELEVWDIPPRESTPVERMTRLRPGELTPSLERIQVY